MPVSQCMANTSLSPEGKTSFYVVLWSLHRHLQHQHTFLTSDCLHSLSWLQEASLVSTWLRWKYRLWILRCFFPFLRFSTNSLLCERGHPETKKWQNKKKKDRTKKFLKPPGVFLHPIFSNALSSCPQERSCSHLLVSLKLINLQLSCGNSSQPTLLRKQFKLWV